MHCGRWQHCGDDRLRLDTRHHWRHDRIVHVLMCSGVQRCGLCYRWLEHCLCKCSVRAPACMHHSRPSLHARMTASIMHHAMQPSDCLVDPGVFDRCLPPMDDAMPWDSAVTDACLPWMMRCLGIWQRAHALRAMATLRAQLPATRRMALLAARPDRARAHVQRTTVALTVLQVA